MKLDKSLFSGFMFLISNYSFALPPITIALATFFSDVDFYMHITFQECICCVQYRRKYPFLFLFSSIRVLKIFYPFIIFTLFQIEHQPHGAKTNDPVINTENDDELILKPGCTLQNSHIRHETEVAFFNLSDYLTYQASKK